VANWQTVQMTPSAEQLAAVVEVAAKELAGLALAVLRNRRELGGRAEAAVRDALKQYPAPVAPAQFQALVAQVTARVGGLGFLDALLPPNCDDFSDIAVNGDGVVRGRRKGAAQFEPLPFQPSKSEVWRAVEALLAPEGRALSEATPSVDAKVPRDPAIGFGGARIKALHPRIAPGDGYPVLALRLFEPRPVAPEQVVTWGVLPDAVMAALLAAVAGRLRVLVVGGTSTGKTTLLSALCHGIPRDVRVVKIEDPEEIWLPHPNVVTLEARDAPPGSDIPPYTVADGVDDAIRLAPEYLIVGEVRNGRAGLSLFRALMSDHAGMTTYHARGPEHAVHRLGVHMYSDMQVPQEATKELFAEALDLVIQIGWRTGRRKALGIWEVADIRDGQVQFRQLWRPGDATMAPTTRVRE
jgi:pilus assembly protein CpaF